MHVVVFTRSTPDTAAKVEVGSNGSVTWGDAATVVNPWDEYALEEAILQAKNNGGKSTVIAIGPEMHNEALKHRPRGSWMMHWKAQTVWPMRLPLPPLSTSSVMLI